MLFLGIDLAWHEGSATKPANESGVVALTADGRIVDAGWRSGLDDVLAWVDGVVAGDALLFVDAPLVVTNSAGSQRLAEKQVGQRYGRWRVSANTTNVASQGLVGVRLRERLETEGWQYSAGLDGPPSAGRTVSECYPYTTIVGVSELGYEQERPRYKRKPRGLKAAEFRPLRAAECDELLRRMGALLSADPPLNLRSHEGTRALAEQRSPENEAEYKHREDLVDAVLCAWTAALWQRHGLGRCQVLGDAAGSNQPATIIAPARPDQRRPSPTEDRNG